MDTEIYEALIARGYTQAQAISGSKVSFHKFQKKKLDSNYRFYS